MQTCTVTAAPPRRPDVYVGRGTRTRIAPFTDRRGVDGARLLVRADPQTALLAGVSAMSAARFETGTSAWGQRLAASGSPWVAQDMRIGNPRTTGLFHTSGASDPDDLLLPFTWSFVVPTLAVVCSRLTDAGSELVMLAHPSPLRSFGREDEVRPLMARACTRVQRAFAEQGALLHHEPISAVADESCPASLSFIVRELGWE